MKKTSASKAHDELRPEYDLSILGGGMRGKYYRQVKAGSNLVLIEPDLTRTFPDEQSVNQALRILLHAASAVTRGLRRRRTAPNKRMQPTRKQTRAADA